MNLGKLLGSGKSFVNDGKPAAYRKDKRVYLPQFVSPKNPFTSAAAVGQAELPAPSETSAPEPAKKTVLKQWAKTEKMPTQPTTKPVTKPAGGWTSRLNPVLLWRGGRKSANAAVRPVQTELSLEKVKVVHNDLTDADVDVVPMKSRPARPPGLDGRNDPPAASQSWEVMGERMLEAKTL